MARYRIFNTDYRDYFKSSNMVVDTMFADPPDNIRLGYDHYEDGLELEEYIDFINDVLETGLKVAKTTYMSFNARWMTEVGALLKAFTVVNPELDVRWLIQGFTFGQHRKSDHGNNFRPIVRIRKPGAPLFPDKVRVESERMRIGDKRANPTGRVPGDVWFSDFLEYSRVVGNAKQRRNWHPTQLHEGLVEDCLLMSTPEDGYVFDPFMGTGTTLRVAMANGWSCYTCDVSNDYCNRVVKEHGFKPAGKDQWVLIKGESRDERRKQRTS